MNASRLPPFVALQPLREELRNHRDVARAWWRDGQVLLGLSEVAADIDEYRERVQRLAAAVLPFVASYGASFGCGPLETVAATADDGGVLIYDRGSQ